MRFKLIFLLIILKSSLITINAQSFNSNEFDKAVEYIDVLKQKKEKGTNNFNRYHLADLDYNETFEIIEIVNRIENDIPGFLPNQLSEAFDYFNVYELREGKYQKSNEKFEFYIKKNLYTYKAWLLQVQNPYQADPELKEFIDSNQQYFIDELMWLIKRVED